MRSAVQTANLNRAVAERKAEWMIPPGIKLRFAAQLIRRGVEILRQVWIEGGTGGHGGSYVWA